MNMCGLVSVENVLKIVYRQQAVFRIRPVYRCSQTISDGIYILYVKVNVDFCI